MKGQHTYIDYVKDTLEAIEKATVFVEGMDYEEFARDDKTIYAVIRAPLAQVGSIKTALSRPAHHQVL